MNWVWKSRLISPCSARPITRGQGPPELVPPQADGSIAFAENPPKKYQDIYPIDFNADMPGIEKEVERIMNLWIEAGVTIFRIDNPHTKPVRFWQDVIAAVTKKHPEDPCSWRGIHPPGHDARP